MYDPVIGRVLSPDIAVQAPGYTQSYNRYSYCMNNPLKYTDPSGWSMMLSNGSVVGYDFNDWGVSNSANLSMPGSGGNWSDAMRGQYGNSMLGDKGSYDKMYGPGAWDIAQSLASSPVVRNSWRQGMITIEQIRRNGGNIYLGPTAGLAGTPGVSVVENQYGKWEYSLQGVWVQTAGRTQVNTVSSGQGSDAGERGNFFSFNHGIPQFETTGINKDWGAVTPGPFVIYSKGGSKKPYYNTHEPGHVIQFLLLGPAFYTTLVAIPSLATSKTQFHTKTPWEKTANQLWYWLTGESDEEENPLYYGPQKKK